MVVLLDGKGLEAALPDMTARMVMAMVPSHVGREQPLHPTTQVAVGQRPEHEMKVVGHQHVPENPQRQSLVGGRHEIEEGRKVAVFVKHFSARVATIENVVANPTGRGSGSTGHAGNLTGSIGRVKEKVECPLFHSTRGRVFASFGHIRARGIFRGPRYEQTKSAHYASLVLNRLKLRETACNGLADCVRVHHTTHVVVGVRE